MSDFQPSHEFEEKICKAIQTPDANPEFVKKLRNELARRPAKMKPTIFKPAWAFAFMIVLTMAVTSAPKIAAAFERVFGYVPGTGLVENTTGLRMLAQPVSQTRDGVTLTITNVFAYEDRVELKYEVSGIAPENDGAQAEDYNSSPTAFCGGVNPGGEYNKEGDAILILPNGTAIERDYTGKYPQNVFAMQPVYEAVIPNDISRITFALRCIPWMRRDAVPENWSIQFDLTNVPAGTIVGEPVINVPPPTEEPHATDSIQALSAPEVTMTLERVIPMESKTALYIHFNMQNADPSLISIMPRSAYVIDSQGQKVRLIGSFIWQPFEHKVGNAFEFVTESKPAPGALTIVVEQAIAYYMPLYTDSPQTTAEEMTFSFDAGENPQHGQTWDLNKIFSIAGYEFKIASAQAVTFTDIETPNFIDGSQGFDYGYQFTIESDPSLGLSVEMDIRADQCWLTDVKKIEPSPLLYTQLCKDSYPKGAISVTIREMSITIEDDLQTEWKP